MQVKHFVDREQEMETLQNEYERDGSALVVLYGRRRVGKTTLISEFIKDKNALFFLASEEAEAQNRTAFKEKAAEFINSDLLRSADVKSWDVLFKSIMDTPFESKPVIVLDEFQYLGKSNPAFPSIFQRIWEEILKDKSVMVILCGSLISMMESQTLAYGSPLYGRRTAQIRLKQIPFGYYHEFFPDKHRRELIEMYSVTGGVPKYIELFSESKDIVRRGKSAHSGKNASGGYSAKTRHLQWQRRHRARYIPECPASDSEAGARRPPRFGNRTFRRSIRRSPSRSKEFP